MIWGSREGIALLRVSLCRPYVVCSFASASDWGLGEGHASCGPGREKLVVRRARLIVIVRPITAQLFFSIVHTVD